MRVHRGFLAAWGANGTRDRVLAYVNALLEHSPDRDKVEVIATGHSLGGAAATLAAVDIARHCGVAQDCLTCYTFGCPRVGNHAFAAEYTELVRPWPPWHHSVLCSRALQ